jgi:hypothetical protein
MTVVLEKKTRLKWLANQKTFLVPLALLYLGFVIARITDEGVTFMAFVPTPAELTAVVLYILNAGYDYLRKLL